MIDALMNRLIPNERAVPWFMAGVLLTAATGLGLAIYLKSQIPLALCFAFVLLLG